MTAAARVLDMPSPAAATGQPVWRAVEELRPHPEYARLNLAPSTRSLAALAERGDAAFQDPLIITRDHILVDGYARLRLAREQGRKQVLCLEHDWTEEEALQQLVQLHGRSDGLNDFIRIMLMLRLEPFYQAQAKSNQQLGGLKKQQTCLSEAERLEVRAKIAGHAGVGAANVSKVKRILEAAHPDILAALQTGEIRIDRGWQWSKSGHERQLELLMAFRSKRGILGTIRKLISAHRSTPRPCDTRLDHILTALRLLDDADLQTVPVYVVNLPKDAMFISEGLLSRLERQFKLTIECSHED